MEVSDIFLPSTKLKCILRLQINFECFNLQLLTYYNISRKHPLKSAPSFSSKTTSFFLCTTCEELQSTLQRATREGTSSSHLLNTKRSHNVYISCKCREFLKNVERGAFDSLLFRSFNIDGARQPTSGVPHFTMKK